MKRGLLDLALVLGLVRANGGNTQDLQRAAARMVPKLRRTDNIQMMAKRLSRSPKLYLWLDEMMHHYWQAEEDLKLWRAMNSDTLHLAEDPDRPKPLNIYKEFCNVELDTPAT